MLSIYLGIAKKMMAELKTLSKLEGLATFATNVDRTRLPNHQEIADKLLADGFHVLRRDDTDWSVFKMYV